MSKNRYILVQWTCYGFFDFIRGYIHVNQKFGEEYQVVPVIPATHDLSKAFSWSNSELAGELDIEFQNVGAGGLPIEARLALMLNEKKNVYRIGCNDRPDLSNCFGYKWLFTPQPKYDIPSTDKAEKLVNEEPYYCIHARVGDLAMTGAKMPVDYVSLYARRIDEIVEKLNDLPIVLVSDCKQLVQIYSKRLIVSEITPKHTGMTEKGCRMTDDEIIDFFTDIKLISSAVKVISICNFPWGSTGFSQIPCAIRGTPYKNIRL